MTLSDLMQQYVEYKELHTLEGTVATRITGVTFYRSSKGNPRLPMLYQSGIFVLGQGDKNIYVDGVPDRYGSGDYLIVGVPIPLECEAFARPGEPLLGISISISPGLLKKMVGKLKAHNYSSQSFSDSSAFGIGSANMDEDMIYSCHRLMSALCSDMEADILGDALLEEVVFRALLSNKGSVLFELAEQEGQYARIAQVLDTIHQNYAAALNVADLASAASMSVSAFHNAFRKVTRETPIQYIKKVRLNKARDLIRLEGKRVNDAARLVGYSSTSQFSREFKRHFNQSPKAAA